MKVLAALWCLATAAFTQSLQVWQAVDVPVLQRERLSGIVHTQFRTRPNLHDYYQARIGPILRFQLSPRATLVGGYYYGEVEQKSGWGNNHRAFGGIETPFAWRGQVMTIRSVVERHFGGESPAELRMREQLQVVRPIAGPVSAILAAETFFDPKGFFQQRSVAGVRLPFISRYRFDLTYIYDARVERAGAGRHVIQAAFRPRRRER